MTTISHLTSLNYSVDNRDGVETVEVAAPVSFQQSGSGKLAGLGTTSIDVSYDGPSGWTTLPTFTASYKVTGSINSSRSTARGTYTATMTGRTQMEGALRTLKTAMSVKFVVTNTNKMISGTIRKSASASGLGSTASSENLTTRPMSEVLAGDGTWTLQMNLTQNLNKISGTAQVAVNGGQTCDYAVKGVLNTRNDVAKLVLTGTGNAKGSSLQITLTSGTVTLIKGKILGQAVKAIYPL